ncbi:xanthine dehydrogenase family protein molybdopterin-binding subunit [Muriicola sp. Z0-33]|uniref:xanthine dehydrogenase family protein molybdopterin-binding subunit n=1 Tax=Muriicola sp. Z0-33 TaxID=2816957 RepID=UPI00223791A7|nr:molybdopterin cofactor-binding domain-containing protein [Muriicola sp. Z0-33]MCW5515407.1 xanthine dehydrogenase family protein molybdopterin-binding subunit [Muriicola sp. Z0-33]
MKKWTRRAFITTGVITGGALVLGVAIRPGNRARKVKDMIAGEGETVLNIWLKLAADNSITVIVPHAEMGQGTHTTLPMMLADEMDADWKTVKMLEAPGDKQYANYALARGFIMGEKDFPSILLGTIDGVFLTATKQMNLQITGGSASVRFTGMYAMRVAGAAARAVLLKAAAEKWEVAEEELEVKDSYISHKESDRTAPFADFVAQAAELSQPAKPRLKNADEFKIMGTSPPRFDIPAKVDGTASFGIDASLPNMKYAAIKASPVFGARLVPLPDDAIAEMPGVQKIVNLDNAVAVIADGYWLAKNALNKLDIAFEKTDNDTIGSEDIYGQYLQDMDKALAEGNEEKDIKKGNAGDALETAKEVIEAEYRVPYLAHATMEPMNCTAVVNNDGCQLWVGSQNPLGFAASVAEALELDTENVVVHNQYLGGGFGRRAMPDVAVQAALIAREVDYPVKLIWSREEDTRQDHYREANISRFKAALGENGKITAWNNQFLFKHDPEEAPHIPYDIGNQFIHYANSETHVPWGWWRSVDSSMHGFFTESFMDEMAYKANKDPYEFRRAHLTNAPRYLKVLEMAAEKANWGAALPENWGRGIAIHKSFDTIVAQVAEIEIIDGNLKVHRVVCAADPGYAFHEDGFRAQMESGIIYGLTAALYGEITIENGAVKQSNFHDYKMVRMNEAPVIESYIIKSDNWPGGAGEPSTPGIAPAVANAVFNASGIRIRELPIKNHNLSARSMKLG